MARKGKTIKLRNGVIGTIGRDDGSFYHVHCPDGSTQLVEGRLMKRVSREFPRRHMRRLDEDMRLGKVERPKTPRWRYKELGGI